jgi:putative ABC transport system permease protein
MLWRKRKLDDFTAEIEQHIQLEAEHLREQGMTFEEAGAAARRVFGNKLHAEERFYESRRSLWWDRLSQDTRYALRTLRKSPGFTAIAVLTIALGIGANTAIFAVVDATLLRPLPYPQPEQLVSIQDDLSGIGAKDVGMSQPEWEDLQHSGIFDDVSPTWFDENNLIATSQPVRVRILLVTPNYFALLGVKPQSGRTFNPQDDSPGLLEEVVISDGLWKRLFGGDPQVLGKTVRMDTDRYSIIGIMPPDFDAPGRIGEERNIEVWAATSFYGTPLPDHPARNPRILPTAIARLKPGLTLAAAQDRLDALVYAIQKQFPQDYPVEAAWKVRLLPLKERVVGSVRQSLLLLLGAVGLVLLIGCVNVANLLLARATTRGREMALRQALGASRKRLIAQMLTESLLLSVVGGALGLLILLSTRALLLRAVPQNLPRLNAISIDWAVLLFALIVSLCAGVIFGLAPALHSGRLDLTVALKEAGRGSTGSGEQAGVRRVLVTVEFALSLVLMIGAVLLLRSFWDLLNVRLGFHTENVVAVRTRIPAPNFPQNDLYRTTAMEAPFLREVLRRAKTLPGVEEAAIGDPAAVPLDESLRDLKRISEGQFFFVLAVRDGQSDRAAVAERSSVTPEYFHLLGLSLLRGRLFNDLDTESTPQVAVVNEAFARTFWPGQDAVGKRFRSTRAESPWITVAGMIADARTESLADAAAPKIYLNLYQGRERRLAVFLLGHFDRALLAEEVREQIQAVDPTLPVFGEQALKEIVSSSLAERRFSMQMIGLFALIALLLAGLGIYGVISYMVNERRHEIGIRLALGAQPRNILAIIFRQGLGMALAGSVIGLAGALVVSRLLAGVLYGVRPADPLTFAGVALLLIGVALFACYIPARRAMAVDPIVALRHE